jgi:hypothetical protein
MDLVDVENDLRAHLHSRPAPRAPEGMVESTRALHRRRRRHQAAVTGACLAVALLFGGVPVLRAALPLPGRSDVATPGIPSTDPLPSLFDLPVRGPLADDPGWLTAVSALDWRSDRPGPVPDTRQVAWAGDVGGERVAMLLGRNDTQAPLLVWFTGPAGAAPEQMTQATPVTEIAERRPQGLLDVPVVGADTGVLVVVGRPGDGFELTTGTAVSIDGEETPAVRPLPAEDSVGVAALDSPVGWGAGHAVQVVRNGQDGETVVPAMSDRTEETAHLPVEVSDPRGLLAGMDGDRVQDLARAMADRYGSQAGNAPPVLLAGGYLDTGATAGALPTEQVVMVGTTLPSGATTAWVSLTRTTDRTTTASSVTAYATPGVPLLDQVLAVALPNGAVAISGPAGGVTAEVLDRAGTVLGTLPLQAGAGVGAGPTEAGASVRVLDGAGATLAEVPLLVGA